jgi:hypothetical protein
MRDAALRTIAEERAGARVHVHVSVRRTFDHEMHRDNLGEKIRLGKRP